MALRILNSCWFFVLAISSFPVWSQTQPSFTVSGTILDARTGTGVPFATVALSGKSIGTVTDEQGRYTFSSRALTDSLVISSMGYTTQRRALNRSKATQVIDVKLEPGGLVLQEVVVRAGENPAYQVIRNLRKLREQNDRGNFSFYEHDTYAKTEIALNNLAPTGRLSRLAKRASKTDSLVDENGNRLLPLLISESVSRFYFQQALQRRHEEIRKTRVQGVGVQDAEFITQLIGGNSFQTFNFYNNSLSLLTKDFASPIGDNWRGYYEFYLADTTLVGDRICYGIDFTPKRLQDLAFTGKLWVDTTSFALCRIESRVGREANLNYVNQLVIEQELEPITNADGKTIGWLPSSIMLTADLTGIGKKSLGMRTRMSISNSGFLVNESHPLEFYNQPVTIAADNQVSDDLYWQQARRSITGSATLPKEDQLAARLIDSLRNVPIVRTAETAGTILATGWYQRGMIDWGPYPFFFAVNQLEGIRLRMGFRTNERFSRHWILRGYAAYGTQDRKMKGGLELDYLLSRKHWTILGVRHTADIDRLGMTPEMMNANPLFMAFARFGRCRGSFFSQKDEFFVRTEPIRGVILSAAAVYNSFTPLFPFHYRRVPELGDQSPLRGDFQDVHFMVEARLARKENYIMDGNERITIGTKRTPVVTIRYTKGVRLLGGDFNYHRFTLRAFQTIRMGSLGRSSYTLRAGYTPSTLPAPLLFPHMGNPTFFYVPNSFNQMQFFEFVSDQYAALHIQHQFEGFLFNRIPLIKKLNWRMIANADILWGSQRKANQAVPSRRPLPDGTRPTHFGALDPKIPYAEVGYGIDNIFQCLQIQVIHRLTYQRPDVASISVKGAIHFSF
ncbi:DUF5686 and carboxypeptidase-like regulatory domain-containing protein [Nibrella viscosa]|uniref:DUF5686 and carboxypeptidase-like regulatory domain-containing protein n=1 Tax=Nibrella viscosa TaxID=1084524 RepID=A0ABP8KSE2_9BACT